MKFARIRLFPFRRSLIPFRTSGSIFTRAEANYNLYYNASCFPRCFDAVGSATGSASDIKISLMQRSLFFQFLGLVNKG